MSDNKTERERAVWRTDGASDWDLTESERGPCYTAWTVYRDGQEILGTCADLVDYRTGFKSGYEAGQRETKHRIARELRELPVNKFDLIEVSAVHDYASELVQETFELEEGDS